VVEPVDPLQSGVLDVVDPLPSAAPADGAQYTLPSRVGCSVMSVTHSWLGPLRMKSRSTRSVAIWSGLAWRHLGRPVAPASPARSHQQGNSVVADHDSAAKTQLGMHSQSTIGATRALVDLDDQLGQPGMADRPGRRRP
jgi:hypothetical protein